MEKFFGLRISGKPFEMFSFSHIFSLIILFLVVSTLSMLFYKIKGDRLRNSFRYSLASLSLLLELLYIIWAIATGDFSVKYSFPLHICEASLVLGGILLINKKYFLFEILYFWGIGGSLQALATPDLSYPFPHVMFFYFFVGHGAVISSVLFMIFAEGYKPTLKSIWRVFLFTNVYMLFIALINIILKSNYLYLCHKPYGSSIIDYLGKWPWYILSLEVVGLVTFFLCYLPFLIKNLFEKGITRNVRNLSA